MRKKYRLKLYICGKTTRSEASIANLTQICRRELAEGYELVVIDVLEHPEMAESDRIMATPTLIKELPLPLRRIIGDLSDREQVMIGLDLGSTGRGESL